MTDTTPRRRLRCAVYTRKSSEEGLDMEFNSLDAQRESCEAYVSSQRAEGWVCMRERYDDGGFSGGTLDRPGLKALLEDVEAGLVDVIVVYKIDRLSRSLMDFAKLVEAFDRNNVTFVSVTQAFNTTTSMGRLWESLFPAEQARIARLLIERVTVSADGLAVDLRTEGLGSVIREMVAPKQELAA